MSTTTGHGLVRRHIIWIVVGVLVALVVIGALIFNAVSSPVSSITASSPSSPVAVVTGSTPPTEPASPAAASSTPVAAAVTPTAASPSPEPVQATSKTTVGSGQQGVTISDWHPVAAGFAQAWIDTSGGQAKWLDGMKPYSTPDLIANFSYTDIRGIPKDSFKYVNLEDESTNKVKFSATFNSNGEIFDGILELQPTGQWLVSTIAPPKK